MLVIILTKVFQTQASPFSRLFWGSFVLFNLALSGGVLLLSGIWTAESTDSMVLANVTLQRNPLALEGLWAIAFLLIGLAFWVAHGYGGRIFAPLGLSEAAGRQMALYWTGAVAFQSFLDKVPVPIILIVVAPFVLYAIFPVVFVGMRMSEGEPIAQVPGYVWLGVCAILLATFFMSWTSTGLIVGADTRQLMRQVVQAYYCEQVNCVPEEIMRWIQ